MNRIPKLASTFSVLIITIANLQTASAGDGSWTQVTFQNQDFTLPGNWLNGIVPGGIDSSAIFNVNLTNDQSVVNVGNQTFGNIFFQDTDTSTAGGYNLGATTDTGPITLDVTSGRSIVNVGNLAGVTGNKKLSLIDPIINADGILRIGIGQFSIRANCPGMTGDYVAASGLTDTRSFLNNWTSLQVVGGATFQCDFANAAANSVNLLNPAIPVTLGGTVLIPSHVIPPTPGSLTPNTPVNGGGTLTITGRNSSANTQVVASVTFNRGSHTINVATGTGAGSVAHFDPTTFTRNAGAVVNLNSTGSTTNILKAGGLVNDANGIIGGWAIDGANWATVSGSGTITPLATYQTSTDPSTWGASDNVTLAANPIAAIGTRSINTLRVTASSTNSIGSGNTLTLSDGGLLGTAGVVQFNDGTIQGPAGGELIIHQTAGTNLMNAVIADNGSPSTLIKSGGGVLMLSGTNANTYTGGTFVNQGTLQIGDGLGGGNSGSLGTGPVTLYGTLQILRTNDLTIGNSISGSGILIKQGPGTLTLTGVNTYNGFNLSVPGVTASGANGVLGYAATRLDAGTLALGSDTALGSGVFRFHNANVVLRSADASTRTIPNNIDDAQTPVTIGAPGTGDLIFTGNMDTGNGSKAFTISNNVTRFNGFIAQGGAPGASTLTKGGSGTLVLGNAANTFTKPFIVTGGTLRISDEGCLGANPPAPIATQLTLNGGTLETTATMTIDDSNRGITLGLGAGTFNVAPLTTLTISVGNSINGTGGSLIKAGTGTMVLVGFNTYSGSTLISAGKLTLDTAGLIPNSGSIVVGSGATFDVSAVSGFTLAAAQSLSGSGTVVGNVSGSGSSTISPGSSPGTLTFNNDLNLAPGDTLVFDLTNNTTIGSGVNDLLVVNGALNLNNNSVIVHPLAAGGTLANGTYRLVNYSGPKTGTLTVNSGTRFSLAIDDSVPNQINLQVTGLPASLVWRGNNGSSWDNGTTTNWLNGATPDVFFNGDTVAFNDTASTFNVSIDATVLPNAVNLNANSDYTFAGSGGLSGIGSINKSGTGTMVLANFGINDYSGATTISSGTLQVGKNDGSGSIGSGPIVNNATLRFQNASSSISVSNLTGTGTLIAEGFQDLILTSGNTYSGPTIVSTNARLAVYATSGSTPASLGNTPMVTVLSDGALYASAAGVYTQALVLNGDGFGAETSGALRGGNVNATWLGPITLASDTFIGNDGSTLIISNSIAGGANNLTKVGAGTVVLAAANTYGTTTINEGPLQLGNGGITGTLGSGPINDNWYLAVNRSDDLTISAQISGSGGLLKSGANTLTLTGNNTFDGTVGAPLGTGAPGNTAVRIDAGTIALGSDTALGTGIVRPNAVGVTIRSADATTRTIANTVDVALDFVLGSATTGDLIFNGVIATGNAAKTLTVSNSVTTFNGEVQGGVINNNITKAGPGRLVLNAINTYGKPTLVNAGTLVVNGVIGSNTVTVANGAFLSGTGLITGPVTVQAGGTLSPGSSIGTLTISTNLTLAGTNLMEVNATTLASDLVQGLTNVTYGGELKVVNLSGAYAAGNSFKLFDSLSYGGAFARINPTTPGAGLAWDTTSLAVNGTLKVVSVASPPHFNSPVLSGSTLTLSGGGGAPNANYILLASTNVALTVPSWDRVTTNQFDSSGNFSISMPVTPELPQRFFLIQLP
jgi:autotransporter-associated beta strand protein